MIDLFKNPRYDFIGRRRCAYVISAAMTTKSEHVRAALSTIHLGDSVIQEFGDAREYIIRAGYQTESAAELAKRIEAALIADPSLGNVEIRRAESVGPQVGHDLQRHATYAVTAALIGILAYIGWRFDLKGGGAAILAVIHDVIVCLGALSLTHHEFSLPVLAALLTVVGYSVNDTIVAYDRLRENRTKRIPSSKSFADQMNDAVNQTLSRTVLTSLTTFLASVTLLMFGGSAIEGFAFVLTVGIVTGTYSTTYIAAALVVDWTIYAESRRMKT